MKRILAVAFMLFYVGALTFGNVCHLVQEGRSAHPMMYFLVWDMFCGWSAFDSRIHLVAEGESGTYYDVTHPPWGEFQPYGYIGRENYDQFQNHTPKLGLNILKHTRHEPMNRLFVVEECWAKKYNMADAVWKARYDDDKDLIRHFYRAHGYADVRVSAPVAVYDPEQKGFTVTFAEAGLGKTFVVSTCGLDPTFTGIRVVSHADDAVTPLGIRIQKPVRPSPT